MLDFTNENINLINHSLHLHQGWKIINKKGEIKKLKNPILPCWLTNLRTIEFSNFGNFNIKTVNLIKKKLDDVYYYLKNYSKTYKLVLNYLSLSTLKKYNLVFYKKNLLYPNNLHSNYHPWYDNNHNGFNWELYYSYNQLITKHQFALKPIQIKQLDKFFKFCYLYDVCWHYLNQCYECAKEISSALTLDNSTIFTINGVKHYQPAYLRICLDYFEQCWMNLVGNKIYPFGAIISLTHYAFSHSNKMIKNRLSYLSKLIAK